MADLHYLSLTEQSQLIRAKKISPLELLDHHLARISKLNPSLNAFVSVAEDESRAVAQSLEKIPADRRGPLHGIPVSIKSSFEVKSWRAECGSVLRKNYISSEDAVLVQRLRAAGAITIGSTNVPEFLMAYETDNLLYGRTNNPWDLSRTSGGSSGGESAAIAAGLSSGGIGSDGGGSGRTPAHFTGICALKPTPGRIPAAGPLPPPTGPFALLGAIGPMAR